MVSISLKKCQQNTLQRVFTKRACNRCGIKFSSYEDRLSILNLNSLEKRRVINDLLLLYKMINNLSDLKFSDYFCFSNIKYNLRRNSMQIRNKQNIRLPIQPWQNSFFIRVAKFWYVLPDEFVTARSISIFKQKLLKFPLSSIITMKVTTTWFECGYFYLFCDIYCIYVQTTNVFLFLHVVTTFKFLSLWLSPIHGSILKSAGERNMNW